MSCSIVPAARLLPPPLMVIEVSTDTAVTVIVVVAAMAPAAEVITAVPSARPVTKPVLLTDAMFGALVDQLTVVANTLPFWSSGVALSESVPPSTTVEPPDTAMLVITGVAEDVGSPPTPARAQLVRQAPISKAMIDR